MPRDLYSRREQGRRYLCPLPGEMRSRQPFLLDARRRRIIAPWQKRREQPGDEARLAAVLEGLAGMQLPAWVCWCWPDRPPEPVGDDVPESWVASWARDRASYQVTA